MSVLALSVRQPWSALILAGEKTVENRTWSTTFRGTLVVHAGQTIEHEAITPFMRGLIDQFGGLQTGYLGIVDLFRAHTNCTDCTAYSQPDQWHWELVRPRPFPETIPGKGRLGLYVPPSDVLAAALQLRGVAG